MMAKKIEVLGAGQMGGVAQILSNLGVKKMKLMTNNPCKIVGLEGYRLEIVERVAVETNPNSSNRRYLKTKQEKMGHILHRV